MEFIIKKNPWTIPIKFSPYYLYRFNYNFNYGSIWFQIHIQIKTNTLLYHQITLSHFHKIFYCFVTCNIPSFFLYMYHSSLNFVISHLKIILFNKSRNFIFFFIDSNESCLWHFILLHNENNQIMCFIWAQDTLP